MSGLSVIIPSRDVRNLAVCVEAVRKHEPDVSIIVIWDAPKTGDPRVQDLWDIQNKLNEIDPQRSGVVLRGEQPFVFARNCNIGINASESDVVLLNDDAILESPLGFTLMQEAAREHGFGLVSATTNLAGNPAQWRQRAFGVRDLNGNTPGNSFPTVAFVCVLIPRTTLDTVGLLDPRFISYGWEDNDYCRRLKNAGLTIGIHDGCFVDHAKLNSTFRGESYAAGDINAGRKIYLEKWGTV